MPVLSLLRQEEMGGCWEKSDASAEIETVQFNSIQQVFTEHIWGPCGVCPVRYGGSKDLAVKFLAC